MNGMVCMTTAVSTPHGLENLEQTIPEKVEALRKALGLSAAQLERLADFPTGTIRRLEGGKQRIYASHLYHIARVTGVSVRYFFTDGDDPRHDTREHEAGRLLNAYMSLPTSALRRDVFDLVESMADEWADERKDLNQDEPDD